MSISLFTDSCCDLPLAYTQQNNIQILPFSFHLKGKDYTATRDPKDPDYLEPHAFYEMLRSGEMSITAQVNQDAVLQALRPELEAGRDVLYICFSSGLSGSYSGAYIAVQQLRKEFPDRYIGLVDSLCASLGQGLLVHKAVELVGQGMEGPEVERWLEDNKFQLHHWFTVDDLNFLKRGGRVSATAAFLGTMLSIKPVLNVDDEGHLIPKEKVQGRKKALRTLVDKMEQNCSDPTQTPVFISHGDCAEDCALVVQMIKKRFGVDVMITNTVGPVIGSHSGPGTVALFFFGDKPRG